MHQNTSKFDWNNVNNNGTHNNPLVGRTGEQEQRFLPIVGPSILLTRRMTPTMVLLIQRTCRHFCSVFVWWVPLLLLLIQPSWLAGCCHAFSPLYTTPTIRRQQPSIPIIATLVSPRRLQAHIAVGGDSDDDTNDESDITTKSRPTAAAGAASSLFPSLSFYEMAVPGPPLETKPDYANIVGPLGRGMDALFLTVFRHQLEYYSTLPPVVVDDDKSQTSKQPPQALQQPQPIRPLFGVPDEYQAIIDLAATMNRKYSNRAEIHARARRVLQSLFPSWMPRSYAVLFSKPFPQFAARMNAWATYVAGTWLMGECEINNVAIDGDIIDASYTTEQVVSGMGQGLLVKRCRFLEESGCASICVNSCKIPTQTYVIQQYDVCTTRTCYDSLVSSQQRTPFGVTTWQSTLSNLAVVFFPIHSLPFVLFVPSSFLTTNNKTH
jgi:hypothetical protein